MWAYRNEVGVAKIERMGARGNDEAAGAASLPRTSPKPLLRWAALWCGLMLSSLPACSDILFLVDPSSIPVAEDQHADGCGFPQMLLDARNPIVRMDVSYVANLSGNEVHDIVSAHLMFDPDVTTVETLELTPFSYEARATFSIPVTDVPDNGANPALYVVHENTFDLTKVTWTATYADGTQREFIDGIIPEPSTAGLLAVSLSAGYVLRRHRRRSRQR